MISRRGFLGAIAAALVAPDPEQLLWRPGAKLISIPRATIATMGWTNVSGVLRVGDIVTIPNAPVPFGPCRFIVTELIRSKGQTTMKIEPDPSAIAQPFTGTFLPASFAARPIFTMRRPARFRKVV